MDKIKIKESIAVEGRYDAHAVRACFDTQVIELGGFGIYNDGDTQALLRRAAAANGLIVLTDSDHAGFQIRARVAEAVRPYEVRHAYVPDIPGKEKRKAHPGAEGLLGVEGVGHEEVKKAVLACVGGQGEAANVTERNFLESGITRSVLYEDGFFGCPNSGEKRKRLAALLYLPTRMSTSAFTDALNRLVSRADYDAAATRVAAEFDQTDGTQNE